MFSRELTVIGSRIGLRYSSAAIIPDAIYRRRHSPAVKAGFHLRDWQYKNKFFYPTASNYNSTLLRASRSVGDRYLGMVEAAGSIPALSIVFSAFFGFVILLRAFILGAVAVWQVPICGMIRRSYYDHSCPHSCPYLPQSSPPSVRHGRKRYPRTRPYMNIV